MMRHPPEYYGNSRGLFNDISHHDTIFRENAGGGVGISAVIALKPPEFNADAMAQSLQ
jgi:hypothetical protein